MSVLKISRAKNLVVLLVEEPAKKLRDDEHGKEAARQERDATSADCSKFRLPFVIEVHV